VLDELELRHVAKSTDVRVGDLLVSSGLGKRFPEGYPVARVMSGRNLAEGVPRSFTLNSNEILEALQEPLSGIVSAVMVALEQSP
ncbi:rod shape-determining protein MreC, partial [Shewanella sp. MBTL60-112-B1]|uniref:rod shape-determining protein MreC n=1 Tax=Shewanella sp. MBTL60-112-B1 TaxID=2815916 RepID=UPI00218039EF